MTRQRSQCGALWFRARKTTAELSDAIQDEFGPIYINSHYVALVAEVHWLAQLLQLPVGDIINYHPGRGALAGGDFSYLVKSDKDTRGLFASSGGSMATVKTLARAVLGEGVTYEYDQPTAKSGKELKAIEAKFQTLSNKVP